VDLTAWLGDRAFARRPGKDDGGAWMISPALRGIAIGILKIDDQECREAMGEVDFWNLGLARDGLVLTPSLPHVIAACGDDAVVPFAAIAPFLSPAGKTQVARFRSSPAQAVSPAG
jgi:hypothetical protein